MIDGTVAVILSGFPRWSETFALPELSALDALGRLGPVFATKPGDAFPQPDAIPFLKRVETIPSGDAPRQATWLADRLASDRPAALHGYFAHRPAELARAAAERLGIPFGFSAHAKDVRKVPPAVLAARAHAARCIVVCNRDVEQSLTALGARPRRIPHGVDVESFRPSPLRGDATPLRLLAVGRLVEKKGFSFLLGACARLEISFSLCLVGEGPLRSELEARAAELGLGDRVQFLGLRRHDELPGLFRWSDVVVVPSVVDSRGDRDGLPNVALEAFASGRPVVASDVADLGSAVRHDDTGLLIAPSSSAELAARLRELADHPETCFRLAKNARALAEKEFDRRDRSRDFAEHLVARYVHD